MHSKHSTKSTNTLNRDGLSSVTPIARKSGTVTEKTYLEMPASAETLSKKASSGRSRAKKESSP